MIPSVVGSAHSIVDWDEAEKLASAMGAEAPLLISQQYRTSSWSIARRQRARSLLLRRKIRLSVIWRRHRERRNRRHSPLTSTSTPSPQAPLLTCPIPIPTPRSGHPIPIPTRRQRRRRTRHPRLITRQRLITIPPVQILQRIPRRFLLKAFLRPQPQQFRRYRRCAPGLIWISV